MVWLTPCSAPFKVRCLAGLRLGFTVPRGSEGLQSVSSCGGRKRFIFAKQSLSRSTLLCHSRWMRSRPEKMHWRGAWSVKSILIWTSAALRLHPAIATSPSPLPKKTGASGLPWAEQRGRSKLPSKSSTSQARAPALAMYASRPCSTWSNHALRMDSAAEHAAADSAQTAASAAATATAGVPVIHSLCSTHGNSWEAFDILTLVPHM